MKTCYIIAGPNGAGKTTFARNFLPAEGNCINFLNVDLIAEGLSPLWPQKVAVAAGRLLLERIEVCVAAGEPFAFESTLSGRAYARHIPRWQQAGYDVVLYYLRLASADIAVNRVRQRVEQGGHHVPEPDIRRRFVRSWENFQQVYRPMVDAWTLLDTTGSNPVLMEQST